MRSRCRLLHPVEMLFKFREHASQIKKIPNGNVKSKYSDNYQRNTGASDLVVNLFNVHVYLSLRKFLRSSKAQAPA